MTKQEVLANYGNLQLRHDSSLDGAYRYVFIGKADDGSYVQVIHRSNVYILEDYVKPDQPVTLNVEPAYHALRIMQNDQLVFEDWQTIGF